MSKICANKKRPEENLGAPYVIFSPPLGEDGRGQLLNQYLDTSCRAALRSAKVK